NVAAEQLVLQGPGPCGYQHFAARQEGRGQVGPGLARAGAGFGNQHAAFFQGVADGLGQRQLGRARHVARQLAGQRAVGAEESGELVGKHDAGRGVDTGQPQDDTPGIPTQRHGYGKMRRLFRFYATHMTMTSSESQTHAVDPARVLRLLTAELDARPAQVAAAVDLLDSGATVPFIARYRKEATGGLDDTVLRQLEVRLLYIRELESRRVAILD